MTLWKWSQTAATNGTADSSCPWPEGMSPSAVNDSARGGMAAVAKYRDDIAGLTATAGSSTAYTYSSFQGFDSLAHMNGAMVAFSPHTTNGATVTINVDSLGAKPLRSAPSVELLAATIIQGTPYAATYNNSTGEWILQGFFGNPYNVPLLGGMDYWGTVAPNSSFIFPLGQALSRTTYAAAFAVLGTTYGAGDGSTTFNVPDKGERVSVMKVASPSRLTSGGGGVDGSTMGSAGGSQTQSLSAAQIPTINSATASTTVTVFGNLASGSIGAGGTTYQNGMVNTGGGGTSSGTYNVSIPNSASFNTGGAGPTHPNVQPTIVCNYILRII